jgi:hypothetical protein
MAHGARSVLLSVWHCLGRCCRRWTANLVAMQNRATGRTGPWLPGGSTLANRLVGYTIDLD